MDSITQAVLGASIQGALLCRWQGSKALLYGAALSTLPDLDVVMDYGDALAEATAAMGATQLLQQPRRAQVQRAVDLAAGLVAQRAGEPRLANTDRADQQQVVLFRYRSLVAIRRSSSARPRRRSRSYRQTLA